MEFGSYIDVSTLKTLKVISLSVFPSFRSFADWFPINISIEPLFEIPYPDFPHDVLFSDEFANVIYLVFPIVPVLELLLW